MKKKKLNLLPKDYYLSKFFFHFTVCLLVIFITNQQPTDARTRNKSKTKRHNRIVKHKKTPEEEQAAREAAARDAAEAKLIEGKNIVLARAYRLYDSGTNENLQGNYKYSILQLKLADELLKEHGQGNSSLAVATLTGLASSAQSAKDYPLAKATYERLLAARAQDSQTLLNLAKLEACQSNFNSAQNYINRLFEISPNNAEGRILADFIANKLKPVKR